MYRDVNLSVLNNETALQEKKQPYLVLEKVIMMKTINY